MKIRELGVMLSGLCLTAAVALAQPAPPPEGGPGPGAPPPGQGPGGPGGGRGQRGNWDPAQMQERMLARFQETLKATPEEWQVIQPRLKDVFEKQRAAREMGGMRGMFRGPDRQGEQVAEVAALEKAIEGGDAAAIKTALEAFRKARAAREADLTKAKDALREVLSVAQEARLALMGTLD